MIKNKKAVSSYEPERPSALLLMEFRLRGASEDINDALNGENGVELDAEYYEKLNRFAYALDVFLRWLSERSTLAEACDV